MSCRKCSECLDNSHHWIPNSSFGDDSAPEELQDVEFVCKHCEAEGTECEICFGSGVGEFENCCTECSGEGVLNAKRQ